MDPWWQQNPAWLDAELAELRESGISYERDEAAFEKGIARLHLRVSLEGEELALIVTFPDLYPYFRFEIEAPALDLAHHQHPFSKALCFMGRRTVYWSSEYSVARLIQDRLRQVLDAGSESDPSVVDAVEQHQAEPFSDYYPYPPRTMILVPRSWRIDAKYRSGQFVVAADGVGGPPSEELIRGVMIEIREDGASQPLEVAALELSRVYSGKQIKGRWLRIDEPIRAEKPDLFLGELLRRHPAAQHDVPFNHVGKGWIQIWGVLFPEETAWRTTGEGWVFVCLYNRDRKKLVGNSRRR